jgi:hypothetical protein
MWRGGCINPILNVSDISASFVGSRSGARRSYGTGGRLRRSGRSAQASARFLCAKGAKGDAARE